MRQLTNPAFVLDDNSWPVKRGDFAGRDKVLREALTDAQKAWVERCAASADGPTRRIGRLWASLLLETGVGRAFTDALVGGDVLEQDMLAHSTTHWPFRQLWGPAHVRGDVRIDLAPLIAERLDTLAGGSRFRVATAAGGGRFRDATAAGGGRSLYNELSEWREEEGAKPFLPSTSKRKK